MTLMFAGLILPARAETAAPSSVFRSTAALALHVWSGFLTKADGNRCAFEPSCSAFARQAIARDGVGGLLLTTDRLMREASAPSYPPSSVDGFRSDPLSDHEDPLRLLSGAHCRRQRRAGAELCT